VVGRDETTLLVTAAAPEGEEGSYLLDVPARSNGRTRRDRPVRPRRNRHPADAASDQA
jgi:hypothetical protein